MYLYFVMFGLDHMIDDIFIPVFVPTNRGPIPPTTTPERCHQACQCTTLVTRPRTPPPILAPCGGRPVVVVVPFPHCGDELAVTFDEARVATNMNIPCRMIPSFHKNNMRKAPNDFR